MKYSLTTSSLSQFIFFFVTSMVGLNANAHQECQNIVVYWSGACSGSGSNALCTEGRQTTQKVCYEVPDGSGPIPGGAGAGTGSGPSSGGGAEDQAKKETEAKKKAEQEKFC